ncbi:YqeG family HAD IIIA-type phosphatase [Anabaena sp. PCC 7108]|uniref:YqeG family HAD IIIA-type phosphatase n=1 Tax=Anabaena sp. PCC 7108 TaxID=163908 RepID=UPI00034D10BB|nr:YqeG family HAD IIIA-type phosphatase [Anabaena sp. PCC 7108]
MINFRDLFPKTSTSLLSQQVYKLAQININSLTKSGIRGIILDLDNTIISEDDRYLSPLAEDWLTQAKLAGLNFFILSNGKRAYRVKYWCERLNIPAISPAKKPFPKAFKQAMAKMQLQTKQVIVIGDSLHTDVLGSWLCGCSCLQVATLPHPPRWWEKIAGKWVQKPYPNHSELEKFNDYRGYDKFRLN